MSSVLDTVLQEPHGLAELPFTIPTPAAILSARDTPGTEIENSDAYFDQLANDITFEKLDAPEGGGAINEFDLQFAQEILSAIVRFAAFGDIQQCKTVGAEWGDSEFLGFAQAIADSREKTLSLNWMKLDEEKSAIRFYSVDSIPHLRSENDLESALWRRMQTEFEGSPVDFIDMSFSVTNTRGLQDNVRFVFARQPDETRFSYYLNTFDSEKVYFRK